MKISLATSSLVPTTIPTPEPTPEESYPGTWLRFSSDKDPGLPEEGEITFRYCVRRKSAEYKPDDKEGTVEYSIDLKDIVDVRADGGKQKTESAEEALDKLYDRNRA